VCGRVRRHVLGRGWPSNGDMCSARVNRNPEIRGVLREVRVGPPDFTHPALYRGLFVLPGISGHLGMPGRVAPPVPEEL
jgi:hypothetical protein